MRKEPYEFKLDDLLEEVAAVMCKKVKDCPANFEITCQECVFENSRTIKSWLKRKLKVG